MKINLRESFHDIPFEFGDWVKDTLTGATGKLGGVHIVMGQAPMCTLYPDGSTAREDDWGGACAGSGRPPCSRSRQARFHPQAPVPRQEGRRLMARELRISATLTLPDDPFEEADALTAIRPAIEAFQTAIEAGNGKVTREVVVPKARGAKAEEEA